MTWGKKISRGGDKPPQIYQKATREMICTPGIPPRTRSRKTGNEKASVQSNLGSSDNNRTGPFSIDCASPPALWSIPPRRSIIRCSCALVPRTRIQYPAAQQLGAGRWMCDLQIVSRRQYNSSKWSVHYTPHFQHGAEVAGSLIGADSGSFAGSSNASGEYLSFERKAEFGMTHVFFSTGDLLLWWLRIVYTRVGGKCLCVVGIGWTFRVRRAWRSHLICGIRPSHAGTAVYLLPLLTFTF